MSIPLQARAEAFLKRSIPLEADYVPGSLAERFIATYAARGALPDDAETMELLGLACMESAALADQLTTPAAAEYFRENSAILEAILAEHV